MARTLVPRSARLSRATRVAVALVALAPCGCGSDASLPWPLRQPPPAAGTAPQYRIEATHRGVAPSGTQVGPALELAWKTEPLAIGSYSASKSSPTVDGERVYIGVDDGRLHAIDIDSGDIVWSFETRRYETEMERAEDGVDAPLPAFDHQGIHGTAAVDGFRVYIGDYDGWLYALDESTGKLVWERKLGGSIGASPVLFGGYVFIAVEYADPDGRVFVLDAEDGEEAYGTRRLGDHPHSSVTLDPARGYMLVGANNGKLFCFDFVDGSHVWTFLMDDVRRNDVKSTATVVDDTVYVTSWDRKLHAVDLDTGEERWAFETRDVTMSSPSYHDGVVYFGSHDGRVYAVDARDGHELWAFDTGQPVLSSPTVVARTEVVIVGSNSSGAHMLDAATGEELWAYWTGGALSSVPVATGRSLYLNDASGTVWRFTTGGE